MSELKDYNIMDIESMDDARLEKSESGKIQVTRVYIKSDVDATTAKLQLENRKLKRALWMARAERAMMTLDYFTIKCRWFKDYMKVEPPGCDVKMISKWATVQRKRRAKAEEYK